MHIVYILGLAPLAFAAVIERDPPKFQPVQSTKTVRLHPNGDKSKCVDLLGNIHQDGQPVQVSPSNDTTPYCATFADTIQVYDCNGTPAQDWVLNAGRGQDQGPARRHQFLFRCHPPLRSRRNQNENLEVLGRPTARLVLDE